MVGRTDSSRELLLGVCALESGAIDREQFFSAVRLWNESPDRSMRDILAQFAPIDDATVFRWGGRVARDLGFSEDSNPSNPESSTPASSGVAGLTMTFAPAAESGDSLTRFLGRGSGDTAPPGSGTSRFRVIRPHARGGLGEVFLAFDGELNRPVALKELQARHAHDPTSQDRFLLEAEVTGRLEHPGVVPVYSLGRHPDGRPFYAMRFIEGETLREAIERFHQARVKDLDGAGRELAFRRLLRSVIDACNAVAYAHSRGVLHRDLKPENIMLGRFGQTLVVDWGMAKTLSNVADHQAGESSSVAANPSSSDPSMTRPGSVLGTPRYMSPEQASGDLDRVGPASDIYALGAILYCVLVGHAPFLDDDLESVLDRVRRGIFPAPRRLRRSVDPILETICLKAMSTDPDHRHPSALELANDLEAWQAAVRYQGEQEQALGQVREISARLYLERAHHCLARGAGAEGMLWLSRALEHAPAEPSELQWVIRTSLCGWHSETKLLERSLRHGAEVHDVAFGPEGRRLVTGAEDGTARLWDISTGALLCAPLSHQGVVRVVAFRPDGKSIATGGDEGLIRRWDAVTGEPVGIPLRHGSPIAAMSFSPDGSRISAIGGSKGFSLWDVETGELVGQKARSQAAVFSHNGATIAVGGDDGHVQLLEASTGQALGVPLEHGSTISALTFDLTDQRLLTASLDGTSRLWDFSTGVSTVTLSHRSGVHGTRFRPIGEAFATACDDGTARLWNSSTGRPIGEPLTHLGRVDRLVFRPDGSMVATGSPDGIVRLWCATTGLPIGPPLKQAGKGRMLAFSPDGRRLATGGPHATARCWKVPDPVEGNAERIACWVRVTTDLDFDEGDAIRKLEGAASWDLRRRLTELGGQPLPTAR